MPVELWGASGSVAVTLPSHPIGYLWLFIYLVAAIILFSRFPLKQLSTRQWSFTAVLCLAAVICSQLFPFRWSSSPLVTHVAWLALLPLLFTAVTSPLPLVLLVGAFTGLGHALGQSHQWVSVAEYGATAVLAAYLLQQRYHGRVYHWLRQPWLVALLLPFLLTPFFVINQLFADASPTFAALDRALLLASAQFGPRLLEGVAAGLVVTVLLRLWPDLSPPRPLVPSPSQRSLQNRLAFNYAAFTAVFIGLTLFVLHHVAVVISTRLLVDNMAQTAQLLLPEPQTELAAQENGKTEPLYRFYRLGDWSPSQQTTSPLWFAQPAIGDAYWQVEADLTRTLLVAVPRDEHTQLVLMSTPYTAVLQQAWGLSWPLLLVMLLAAALFYANVRLMGRDLTTAVNEIVDASNLIAAGGSWTPAQSIQRDDEIGHLQRAFSQMQRSMRKRLNELSLLFGISHDVATSIDLHEGIPAILRGVLRGTGAVGARAVVPNPSGGNPLTFGEGQFAEAMASLDRVIMTRLRHSSNLMLANPDEICHALSLENGAELPVPALLAIPLRSHDRFQGILWLGFRQPHNFDEAEHNLLSTLSTQAAVLVENARLYATAESGRRRLAAVLASTSDAVIVTDQTERILLLNPAAERMFALEADQVRNRPAADVLAIRPLVDALMGEDDRPQNVEIATTDGRVHNAIASTIFSNEGQVFGRVAVLRDITYLKEIDKMKSDFVATVSHDLRSPLTFMRGYATMLPMVGDLTEKQREYIDKILGGIDQMAQLVDDLLDLGRIEAGVDMEQEEIELRPLLNDIATEYWQHAHLSGIQIQVAIADNVAQTIKGDLSLIRQAVTNLVGNGIKYAPQSGEMVIGAQQSNGELIISIKDNGPGITKEDQIRLFEKFYRVKERGTERIKGSGLGLAIVKSIAERHGGRAWVQSQRGKGTTFFISFPVQESVANNAN